MRPDPQPHAQHGLLDQGGLSVHQHGHAFLGHEQDSPAGPCPSGAGAESLTRRSGHVMHRSGSSHRRSWRVSTRSPKQRVTPRTPVAGSLGACTGSGTSSGNMGGGGSAGPTRYLFPCRRMQSPGSPGSARWCPAFGVQRQVLHREVVDGAHPLLGFAAALDERNLPAAHALHEEAAVERVSHVRRGDPMDDALWHHDLRRRQVGVTSHDAASAVVRRTRPRRPRRGGRVAPAFPSPPAESARIQGAVSIVPCPHFPTRPQATAWPAAVWPAVTNGHRVHRGPTTAAASDVVDRDPHRKREARPRLAERPSRLPLPWSSFAFELWVRHPPGCSSFLPDRGKRKAHDRRRLEHCGSVGSVCRAGDGLSDTPTRRRTLIGCEGYGGAWARTGTPPTPARWCPVHPDWHDSGTFRPSTCAFVQTLT
jgi:hypothetical protein